jgi:hypothetical protein
MKCKFIMMLFFISGIVQVGTDIDVYMQPLLDDLLILWAKEGFKVCDEHKHEHFNL